MKKITSYSFYGDPMGPKINKDEAMISKIPFSQGMYAFFYVRKRIKIIFVLGVPNFESENKFLWGVRNRKLGKVKQFQVGVD